jgi:DNA-binding response OmpR family regulator
VTLKQKILVVEDDEDLRGLVRHILTNAGYDVIEAGDGLAALQAIESVPVRLVLLDIGLPFIDGFDVYAELRQRKPDMPILVLTGRAPEELTSIRPERIIRKPVRPLTLLAAVRMCLT